jgi:hypothetical protein
MKTVRFEEEPKKEKRVNYGDYLRMAAATLRQGVSPSRGGDGGGGGWLAISKPAAIATGVRQHYADYLVTANNQRVKEQQRIETRDAKRKQSGKTRVNETKRKEGKQRKTGEKVFSYLFRHYFSDPTPQFLLFLSY